jgi:hypothetical protein
MIDTLPSNPHREDVVAGITPLLASVIEGPSNMCLTLNLEGDADRWVQYMADSVNAAYFGDEPPSEDLLSALGPAIVTSFEARKYMTVTLAARDPESIAAWMYDYFWLVLECGDAFVLDAEVEDLG